MNETQSRVGLYNYRPELMPGGDLQAWRLVLALAAIWAKLLTSLRAYRRSWAYAAHRPTEGRHVRLKGSPRHAAPTTFFQRIGWAKYVCEVELRIVERELARDNSPGVELAA
jgi:hypothetical protein